MEVKGTAEGAKRVSKIIDLTDFNNISIYISSTYNFFENNCIFIWSRQKNVVPLQCQKLRE